MPKLVTHGASLKCNQGTAPCSLAVPPDDKIDSDSAPIATIDHHAPSTNIASFGMCNSSTNPSVISATSAASGVHTPMPCQPATANKWSPGAAHVTLHDRPALTDDSTCACQWNGTISVEDANTEAEIV